MLFRSPGVTNHAYAVQQSNNGLKLIEFNREVDKVYIDLRAEVIRRIGVVPNHYAIGYTANGMSVWDVDDARIAELMDEVGEDE